MNIAIHTMKLKACDMLIRGSHRVTDERIEKFVEAYRNVMPSQRSRIRVCVVPHGGNSANKFRHENNYQCARISSREMRDNRRYELWLTWF